MDTVLAETHITGSCYEVQNVPGFLQIVHAVLTPEECTAIIEIAETQGFVRASIYTDAAGKEYFSEHRKSARCILDSPEFVRRLWPRIAPHVPPTGGTSAATCVGLNERLRILRYDPGDEFKPHSDGSYTSPSGAVSNITVLLYLNEGYEGGFTHFLDSEGESGVGIPPHIGMAAMQDQSLIHWVPPLIRGRKYVIRTEIMYMPNYTAGPTKEIRVYD